MAGLESNVSREHVVRMCDAMVRRGPDASGIFASQSVALGHRRLKVLELSEAGRQPMTDPSGLVSKGIDPVGIGETVMMGAPIDGQTPLRQVKFLGAGETLRIKAARVLHSKYRRTDASTQPSAPSQDELNEITRSVIDEHLASDVPLAFLLSGGVDSTALLALARQASDRELRAFTLGFAESHLDESDVARETARQLNVAHTVVTVSANDLCSHVEAYLNAMDLPILDGFNVYSICRIVREVGFVVLLSGQGGDEAFCGYDSFRSLPKVWRLLQGRGIRGAVSREDAHEPVDSQAVIIRSGVGSIIKVNCREAKIGISSSGRPNAGRFHA